MINERQCGKCLKWFTKEAINKNRRLIDNLPASHIKYLNLIDKKIVDTYKYICKKCYYFIRKDKNLIDEISKDILVHDRRKKTYEANELEIDTTLADSKFYHFDTERLYIITGFEKTQLVELYNYVCQIDWPLSTNFFDSIITLNFLL